MKRLVLFGGVGSVLLFLLLFVTIAVFSSAIDARSGPSAQSAQSKSSGSAGALDSCYCGDTLYLRWADLTCDGVFSPVDVVRIINYVYKGHDQRCLPPGWYCPFELGDINKNGHVDPADVVAYVNCSYKCSVLDSSSPNCLYCPWTSPCL